MHYHAVSRWAGANTSHRTFGKLKCRNLDVPIAPEASHPLVQYDANGTATHPSLLQAITNSSFDPSTGKLIAIGPTGVDVLVRIHNAQLGTRNIARSSFSHLTNACMFRDRELLKDLKRRTSSSRVHLYDETRTCISCNKHTSHPKKYAPSGPSKFTLCPTCFDDRSTMGSRHLVPLSMMTSCFSGSPLLRKMISSLACVTRAGIMGLSTGGTHRGLLLQLQPLGGMRPDPPSGAQKKSTKKRFCASNDYWWSLFPQNTERANAWKNFVWRLSKAASAHNRNPLALVASAAQLTSTGRAIFPESTIDRLFGKEGDVCMGMAAQAVVVDTKTTAYLTFRIPGSPSPPVCVASVACVGVIRALFAGKLTINVHLVPLCVGSEKRTDSEVDATRSSGFPANVKDGAVSFCNGEAITYEHLWHCFQTLGAQIINVTGAIASAAKAAEHTNGESNCAWKHGGVFHEIATVPFHGINILHDLLAWDAHDSVAIQKSIRDESQTPTNAFKHPTMLNDLVLVASRAHKFI